MSKRMILWPHHGLIGRLIGLSADRSTHRLFGRQVDGLAATLMIWVIVWPGGRSFGWSVEFSSAWSVPWLFLRLASWSGEFLFIGGASEPLDDRSTDRLIGGPIAVAIVC